MIEQSVHAGQARGAETVLRADLARADGVAKSIQPILRHLLAADDDALFSEEIMARLRASFADLAGGLVAALAAAAGKNADALDRPLLQRELTRALMENRALLSHVHATALEWLVTDRLQAQLALDPVVSPLLQALIASPDAATQALAMGWLATQARWCQAQRRMQFALVELPGELFDGALLAFRVTCTQDRVAPGVLEAAEAAIRAGYKESAGRLAMAARLVAGLGGRAQAALSLDNGGIGLFASALARASGQGRDLVLLSLQEAQASRLVLSLRACGLRPSEIGRQVLALHPEYPLPADFEQLGVDIAASILASGRLGG